MAITHTLNTRIALKYDTLENWRKSASTVDDLGNPKAPLILKKGEIAIAEIPNKTINNDSAQSQLLPPTVAMKVGDGAKTFEQLPWVQAVAGDVYAWAKKANAPKLSELTEIDKELADMVGDIIDSTDKIQDTDTFYKVGSEKDGDGNHKFVLHAYKKGGTRYPDDTMDITIDWSDLDTWMAGENSRVQGLITSALSTLVPLEVVNPDKKFVGRVEQVNGQIKVTKVDVEAGDIQGQLLQSQVSGLTTLQNEFDIAKGQLANTDGTISDSNLLMTASAVQRDLENAIEALDELIVTEQGNGNYVTSVTRVKDGSIVVTRDELTSSKIGDWKEAVTDKLALKADKADFFYSNDTKPSATNYIVRKEDIDGLAHGLHFRGFVESDPTTWADPTDNPDTAGVDEEYIAGDIVIREASNKIIVNNEEKEYVTTLEYIFDGNEWQELGSEGFHATKDSVDALRAEVVALEAKHDKDKEDIDKAIEDAIKSAGGNADAAIDAALDLLDTEPKTEKDGKFATTVTQTNGKVTVVYANLDEADIPDEMSTGKIDGLQAHMDATNAHFNAAVGASGQDNGLVEGNPLTTKAYVDSVAASAAEAAVNGLNATKKDDDKKFATIVNQVNGEIEVTYDGIAIADLPENIPTTKLADNAKITAVLNNIDGGAATEVLKDNNKLATTNTVSAAVEAGVAALDSELHAIAKSGNVNDLVQTANEVLFFDCGSASTVI